MTITHCNTSDKNTKKKKNHLLLKCLTYTVNGIKPTN